METMTRFDRECRFSLGLLMTAWATVSVARAESQPRALAFSVVPDVAVTARTAATRKVFKSAAEYTIFFGRQPPSDVDFSREWLVFYAAGSQRTGGYEASIDEISLAAEGPTLSVTTSLVSPGRDCVVTQAFTTPAVLARFQRPDPAPADVRFFSRDTERACGSGDPCAAARCGAGTRCVAKDGAATCEPDACKTDADCALVDDYCGGCTCRALPRSATPPRCDNAVQCFRQPCAGFKASCRQGVCEATSGTSTR